ncbi:hypothetical protein VYU27_010539, partial [Nannochloropsis oceanica]
LRHAFFSRRARKSQAHLPAAALHEDGYNNAKPLESGATRYPHSVSLSNISFFFFCPTLCYQPDYPRAPTIRLRTLASLTFRIIVMTAFAGFIIDQQIHPIIQNTMSHVDSLDLLKALGELLRLAIPSTFVWLIFFYVYFHCTLNLFAELTRFGDRLFFKDWWNSTSFSRYW